MKKIGLVLLVILGIPLMAASVDQGRPAGPGNPWPVYITGQPPLSMTPTPSYTPTPTFTGTVATWQAQISSYTATPTLTPTFTMTLTPGNGTPTATPTPYGLQITSVDTWGTLSVTFFCPNGKTTNGWTLEIFPSTNLGSAGASLVGFPFVLKPQISTTAGGVVFALNSLTTNGTYFNAVPLNNSSGLYSNGIVCQVRVTPSVTAVLTIIYVPFTNVSDIPKKYRYLFEKGYDESHGFKIYYKVEKIEGQKYYLKPAYVRSLS